jgi:hypothetical protein
MFLLLLGALSRAIFTTLVLAILDILSFQSVFQGSIHLWVGCYIVVWCVYSGLCRSIYFLRFSLTLSLQQFPKLSLSKQCPALPLQQSQNWPDYGFINSRFCFSRDVLVVPYCITEPGKSLRLGRIQLQRPYIYFLEGKITWKPYKVSNWMGYIIADLHW